MTKAITHTYSFVHEYRRQITLTLIATCAVLVLIYAFNLYRVISHTITLQQITAQESTLSTSIQTLDTQYQAVSGKITPDTLRTYGFGQGKISAFISRTASLGSVALAGHEL